MPERIKRFVKNLVSALGHSLFEDGEMSGIAILALASVVFFWLAGLALYELILDPHVTTVASLNSLSIDPPTLQTVVETLA